MPSKEALDFMCGDSLLNVYSSVDYVTPTPPSSPIRESEEAAQTNLIAIEGYDGNVYTAIATRTPKYSGKALEGLVRGQYPPLIQEIMKKNKASEAIEKSHHIKAMHGLKKKGSPVSKTDIVYLKFLIGDNQCATGLDDKLKKYGFIS